MRYSSEVVSLEHAVLDQLAVGLCATKEKCHHLSGLHVVPARVLLEVELLDDASEFLRLLLFELKDSTTRGRYLAFLVLDAVGDVLVVADDRLEDAGLDRRVAVEEFDPLNLVLLDVLPQFQLRLRVISLCCYFAVDQVVLGQDHLVVDALHHVLHCLHAHLLHPVGETADVLRRNLVLLPVRHLLPRLRDVDRREFRLVIHEQRRQGRVVQVRLR